MTGHCRIAMWTAVAAALALAPSGGWAQVQVQMIKQPDGSFRAVPSSTGTAVQVSGNQASRPATPPSGASDPSQPQHPPGSTPPGQPAGPSQSQPGGSSPAQPSGEPQSPADLSELQVEPDEEGRMLLHLHGQKWKDVLQMLGNWSDRSLDWTDLPSDTVNLTTPRKYTFDEAATMFNRMLLDRGFTMLVHLRTLSVHKLETINPALVPRVAPEGLDDRQPYEWVKVVFDLSDWLQAEEAAKDLEQLKSQYGKVLALKATNRIAAMDAVANLIQMRTMLSDEAAASGTKQRVRVFPITYRNALDVDTMLRELLGLKPRGSDKEEMPTDPQQLQMRMQIQQMRIQQAQQQGQAAPQDAASDVRLVVNQRENSILVDAPPEKMALVEQAIKAFDIPHQRGGGGLSDQLIRFQSYKLSTLDPEPLVEMLQAVGDLDFSTHIQADKDNQALIVYGPLADHVKIKSLLDKLDGSGRKFYVRKLKRLRADYVAGTIAFMMGVDKEDESSQRRSYYYYSPYGMEQEKNESSSFSVDADVQNNWLLLRANEHEMEEIENLLVQLGEVRVPGTNASTVRYLEAVPGEDTEDLLERIKRIWPSLAPNPLDIQPAPPEQPEQPLFPPQQGSEPTESDQAGSAAQPGRRPMAEGPMTRTVAARSQATEASGESPDARTSEEHASAEPSSAGPNPVQAAEQPPAEPAQAEPAQAEPAQAEPAQAEQGQAEQGQAGEPPADEPPAAAAPSGQPPSAEAPESPAAPPASDAQRAADEELLRQFLEGTPAQGPAARPRPATQGPPPPVSITRGPGGELILSSPDTRALDLLEDLISEQAPPPTRHEIFRLRYADAYDVYYVLKDYFEEDEDEGSGSPYGILYYDPYYSSGSSESSRRLSDRPELKFIYDLATNSIVVKNADEQQLRTIHELIDFYDQPAPPDAQTQRVLEYFQLRYAKAEEVTERVKEIFIDLLTPNDKARQAQQQGGGERPERVINYNFGDSEDAMRKVPKFKGQLYITADTASNSVAVLAPRYVMEWVEPMILHFDNAARPSETIHTMRISGHVNPEELQAALNRLLGQQPAAAPQGEPAKGQPQHPPGQPPGANGQVQAAAANGR